MRQTITVRAFEPSKGRFLKSGEARELLKISSRLTWSRYLKSLGLFGRKRLYLNSDIKLLLGLKLWCEIKPGNVKFSREKFAQIASENLAEQALWLYGSIDLNQKLEELKDEYQRQRNTNHRRNSRQQAA
ncbi:MAG TPA: hypothetical protein VK211_12695 [Kamptonema sp.]|nr:hypothetical protein [Kamptonema sp.]